MLIIVCGEDIEKARTSLLSLISEYKKKEYLVHQTPLNELIDTYKSATGVIDLFGQESIYSVDYLSSRYTGRTKTEFKEIVQELSKHKTFHLLDWEGGKSAYDLTALKKIATTFIEEKPNRNIFQLLDSAYPGSLKSFISLLNSVAETQEEMFIFTLLWRHIRKLIQAKENILQGSIPPWQKGKLLDQSSRWDNRKLMSFYEGLIRIDAGMKTSTSTFSIKESIEILACYYLK